MPRILEDRYPAEGRHGSGVEEASFPTPFGEGVVVVRDGVLIEVRMPSLPPDLDTVPIPYSGEGKRTPASGSVDAPIFPESEPHGEPANAANRWATELAAYFRGERTGWALEDVDVVGLVSSTFRQDVYRALLSIPPGETVSYGELALLAGHPGAARAVGTAMAANPIPPVVPCHRVVRGDGTPGRYGDDDRWKLVLLELERTS